MPVSGTATAVEEMIESWLSVDAPANDLLPTDAYSAYRSVRVASDGLTTTDCMSDESCDTVGTCGTTVCVTEAPCIESARICGC